MHLVSISVSFSFFPLSTWASNLWVLFSQWKDSSDDTVSEAEKQMVWAAQKDPRQFKVIYEMYFEKIFLYLHRRVKDEAIADDLTSQTFYLALAHISKFKFQGVRFSSWLYKIATNELNQFFRKNQQSTRHVSLSSSAMAEFFKEAETENEPEALPILLKILEMLSHEEIQLIEWRFFEGRSFREIGFILEMTEANAKTRMYRLLDKIKAKMPRP
jgi:RNA polymerase sigma-70 factor (ECF subfamily)